jgi:hypothetical protein
MKELGKQLNDMPQAEAPRPEKINISCDQVAWLNNVLERHFEAAILSTRYPSISRLSSVARQAAIIEIMEIVGLDFDESGAAHNAIGSVEIQAGLSRRIEAEPPESEAPDEQR